MKNALFPNILKKWLARLTVSSKQTKKRIFWVIEESDVYQCCVAIKFYNQADDLVHCEEMKDIGFKTLDESQIKKLNRKAREVLLSIC